MTSPALAIGIDVGTSGVRVVCTTEDGEQVSLGSAATRAPLNRPANWWQACTMALHEALPGIDANKVVALAVDGTSGTLLAIDASGQPVGDALMYNEGASQQAIHARLQDTVPEGNPARSATSGLAKAVELQERTGTASVIHQADWIVGMLGGDFSHSDENNALKTGYDPVTRCWPDWINTAGMHTNLLPDVHPVATPVATISTTLSAQTGLPTHAVICSGTTDGCASFLATGAHQNGDAVTALGTTLTLKQLVAKPVFNADYGVYSHRIGDLWLAGGASNTGGAVLDKYFSREQLASLSTSINTDRLLGLHYYPLLTEGERFPINDPALAPVLSPRPDSDAEFLQAIFEGIAEIEQLGYKRVAELSGSALTSVRSVGGGATNSQWTSLRQRILGVPFAPALSVQAAAGTARLAWQGYARCR